MKLCLVIPGNSVTCVAACRVFRNLGFSDIGAEDGIYVFEGESGLDVVVLDWEEQAELKKSLETLRAEREPLILFCNDGAEKAYLEQVLGDDNNEWNLRPYNIDLLIQRFLN